MGVPGLFPMIAKEFCVLEHICNVFWIFCQIPQLHSRRQEALTEQIIFTKTLDFVEACTDTLQVFDRCNGLYTFLPVFQAWPGEVAPGDLHIFLASCSMAVGVRLVLGVWLGSRDHHIKAYG